MRRDVEELPDFGAEIGEIYVSFRVNRRRGGRLIKLLEGDAGGDLEKRLIAQFIATMAERHRQLVLFRSPDDDPIVCMPEFDGHELRIALFEGAPQDSSPALALTKRQLQLLRILVGSSMPHRDIAKHLKISVGTVRKHVEHIYRIFGVRSRLELVEKSRIRVSHVGSHRLPNSKTATKRR